MAGLKSMRPIHQQQKRSWLQSVSPHPSTSGDNLIHPISHGGNKVLLMPGCRYFIGLADCKHMLDVAP